MKLITVLAVLVATTGTAAADDLDPRVLVLPVEGTAPETMGGLSDEIAASLARGAGTVTTTVARATSTLGDTAVIVGCDPATPECLDAVAAALNVDQLLIARIAPSGEDDATVEIVAVTREAEPVQQTFAIRAASKEDDLLAIEQATPTMLEAGEARRKEIADEKIRRPDPVPPPPVEREPNLTPWLVVGGGGALVAAGAIFWGLAGSTQGEIDGAPTETAADLERLADLEATARTRATFGNVLVVAGGVAIAGGLTWYVLDRRASKREVAAAPLLVPGGGGIGVAGSW